MGNSFRDCSGAPGDLLSEVFIRAVDGFPGAYLFVLPQFRSILSALQMCRYFENVNFCRS